MAKKILTIIGCVFMLAAPFVNVGAHYGRPYNLFDESAFGILGKILYGAIIIGTLLTLLSLLLKKRWISIIGIVLVTLVLLILFMCVANLPSSDTVKVGMYAIIVGGIILWISIFMKDGEEEKK